MLWSGLCVYTLMVGWVNAPRDLYSCIKATLKNQRVNKDIMMMIMMMMMMMMMMMYMYMFN